jgi:hypothetical protein
VTQDEALAEDLPVQLLQHIDPPLLVGRATQSELVGKGREEEDYRQADFVHVHWQL